MGVEASPATDAFALGNVLLELLDDGGRVPNSSRATVPSGLGAQQPRVSPSDPLRCMIERMVSPNPAQRPAGLEEVTALLKAELAAISGS
jgi:hypothetical protein